MSKYGHDDAVLDLYACAWVGEGRDRTDTVAYLRLAAYIERLEAQYDELLAAATATMMGDPGTNTYENDALRAIIERGTP